MLRRERGPQSLLFFLVFVYLTHILVEAHTEFVKERTRPTLSLFSLFLFAVLKMYMSVGVDEYEDTCSRRTYI